jgi:hypothetical protein
VEEFKERTTGRERNATILRGRVYDSSRQIECEGASKTG